MEQSLEVRGTDDLTTETKSKILALRDQLQEMGPKELHGAIIWAEAIAAAGKAHRAWEVAREAAELLIRAQRELGAYLNALGDKQDVDEFLFMAEHPGRPREIKDEVVAEIKKMHEEGRTVAAIARELNKRGVPAPRGGKWYSPGVKRALFWGQPRSMLDPKEEGAYSAVALIPDEIFNSTVDDLLERGKSSDPRTVLRISRLRSLEFIEEGIHRSWDGSFFTTSSNRTAYGGYRRSHKRTLEEVREELFEEERMSRKQPKVGASKALDAAFSEARRDAQALNMLRSSLHTFPDVRDIVGEAELLQAKVASLLFEAYRQNEVLSKERGRQFRPVKMPIRK